MERIEQEHGYYTIDELGRFHSYNDEPAIVVADHVANDMNGTPTPVNWYRSWYENGKMIRSERNTGEVFLAND